jgi:hypothetical protein
MPAYHITTNQNENTHQMMYHELHGNFIIIPDIDSGDNQIDQEVAE